jgi:hypothetical protein
MALSALNSSLWDAVSAGLRRVDILLWYLTPPCIPWAHYAPLFPKQQTTEVQWQAQTDPYCLMRDRGTAMPLSRRSWGGTVRGVGG